MFRNASKEHFFFFFFFHASKRISTKISHTQFRIFFIPTKKGSVSNFIHRIKRTKVRFVTPILGNQCLLVPMSLIYFYFAECRNEITAGYVHYNECSGIVFKIVVVKKKKRERESSGVNRRFALSDQHPGRAAVGILRCAQDSFATTLTCLIPRSRKNSWNKISILPSLSLLHYPSILQRERKGEGSPLTSKKKKKKKFLFDEDDR